MAVELSSNWKKLQATLKKQPVPEKKPLDPRKLNSQAKRKRLEDKEINTETSRKRKRGMDSNGGAKTDKSAAPSASLALWAEDNNISAKDLAEAYGLDMKDVASATGKDLINEGLAKNVELGQYLAIDCEMVGVGGDEDRSVLARVSIVNFHGIQVYDSFVRPKEFVTDWRTHVSGVSSKHMVTARSFDEVQKEVADLMRGRILVGHAIKNDLDAMMLGHPKKDIRDTSRFSGFRKYSAGKTPSLKRLAKELLGVDIQGGQHSSIEDARATMLLFRRHKPAFDAEVASRYAPRPTAAKKKTKTKK